MSAKFSYLEYLKSLNYEDFEKASSSEAKVKDSKKSITLLLTDVHSGYLQLLKLTLTELETLKEGLEGQPSFSMSLRAGECDQYFVREILPLLAKAEDPASEKRMGLAARTAAYFCGTGAFESAKMLLAQGMPAMGIVYIFRGVKGTSLRPLAASMSWEQLISTGVDRLQIEMAQNMAFLFNNSPKALSAIKELEGVLVYSQVFKQCLEAYAPGWGLRTVLQHPRSVKTGQY